MEQFVTDYPTSTKRNTAYLDVADYYFETGKYPHALKWYSKVDQSSMSRRIRNDLSLTMVTHFFRLKSTKMQNAI